MEKILRAAENEELLDIIRRTSKPMRPQPAIAQGSGRLPRAPRAVLFDVYGTLLLRADHGHPLKAPLAEETAREHEALRGRGVAHPEVDIESIWKRLFPEAAQDEIRRMIVEHELAAHPVWPMPGAKRVLAGIARRGIRLGIVSNAQFYTPLFLEALLQADTASLGFSPELSLYSGNFGIAKPDAALFTIARQRLGALGIAPRETVMVGNSAGEDVAPAARVGFMTVLAALDRRSYAPEGPVRPDAVIASLEGLERLIAACV